MSSIMVNALWITLIGMGLVFIALILLWGLMELMMRVTSRAARAEVADAAEAEVAAAALEAPAASGRSKAALAAAVAVAVALAQHQAAAHVEGPVNANISVWQAAMRTSRLNQRANQYMRKQRGSR